MIKYLSERSHPVWSVWMYMCEGSSSKPSFQLEGLTFSFIVALIWAVENYTTSKITCLHARVFWLYQNPLSWWQSHCHSKELPQKHSLYLNMGSWLLCVTQYYPIQDNYLTRLLTSATWQLPPSIQPCKRCQQTCLFPTWQQNHDHS